MFETNKIVHRASKRDADTAIAGNSRNMLRLFAHTVFFVLHNNAEIILQKNKLIQQYEQSFAIWRAMQIVQNSFSMD